MQRNTKTVLGTVLLGAFWVVATAYGLRTLIGYETSPGSQGLLARQWPGHAPIQLSPDLPTMVMFAHPRCPCTRASIEELAKVMARVQGKVRAYVAFYTPNGSAAGWEDTDLRHSAAQIPGVTVVADSDGLQAQRFGAETSGHTFVFDPQGHLLFNGGITSSRGHSGENAGEDAIVSLLDGQQQTRTESLVFGCSLISRNKVKATTTCLK